MAPINYDSVTFEVGDLVKFIGLNYTPDYYIPEDEPEAMGIIIDVVTVKGVYITRAWMYRVYWFKIGTSPKSAISSQLSLTSVFVLRTLKSFWQMKLVKLSMIKQRKKRLVR